MKTVNKSIGGKKRTGGKRTISNILRLRMLSGAVLMNGGTVLSAGPGGYGSVGG